MQRTAPHYANWGWRLLAYLIDALVFYAPLILVTATLAPLGMLDDADTGDGPGSAILGFVGLLSLAFTLVNRIVFDGAGQSIGRRLTGTKLVSKQSGQPIGAGRAALRHLCHILDTLPFYIGYLLPLITPERQTIADLVMRTVVIRVRD